MPNSFCPYCGTPLQGIPTTCPNCNNKLIEDRTVYESTNNDAHVASTKQSGLHTALLVVIGVVVGMLLSIGGIGAYWYFSNPQTDAMPTDTVVPSDTVSENTRATTSAANPAASTLTLSNGGEHQYTGTIAGQRVAVTLNNTGDNIVGLYRYTKLTSSDHFTLVGSLHGNKLEPYERNDDTNDSTA